MELNRYYSEIDGIKRITKEQRKELIFRMRQGDKEARRQLIESGLRLVLFVINRYFRHRLDYSIEDLIQEGNLGLIRAIDVFDPTRSNFERHVTVRIKGVIKRFLAKERKQLVTPELIFPVNVNDFVERLKYDNLLQCIAACVLKNMSVRDREIVRLRFGWDKTSVLNYVEISRRFGLCRKQVNEICLKAVRKVRQELQRWLGVFINSRQSGNEALQMFFHRSPGPDEELAIIEDKEKIQDAIDKIEQYLSTLLIGKNGQHERNREIVRMYFGLSGYQPHSQQEVAERFDIAQTVVSLICVEARTLLREKFADIVSSLRNYLVS